MNTNKVKHLLKQEESFKLDFKLKLSIELDSEKKELVRDIIAMANTPGGRGYIIFGVKDKTREVVGIEDVPENIEERLQQIIANRSMPPVPIAFDMIAYEGKKLGVITIYKSMQVPHQMLMTGAFYIRRGSTTGRATRHEIANMLQQYGMLSFENVPCRNSNLADLNESLIKKHIGHLQGGIGGNKTLLEALGIITVDLEKESYYPTYGGLLLFGILPQMYIPQAVLEVETTNQLKAIGGNIFNMIDEFEGLMEKILPSTYPKIGLLEVVTNAIIHRNYWNNEAYIKIYIREEYIKVTNPMSHEWEEARNRQTRVNTWLYTRLLLMGQKQNDFHLGIGLEKTKAIFKEKGGIRIFADPLTGLFEVTLPAMKLYKKGEEQ